jgi:hypothetical protein
MMPQLSVTAVRPPGTNRQTTMSGSPPESRRCTARTGHRCQPAERLFDVLQLPADPDRPAQQRLRLLLARLARLARLAGEAVGGGVVGQ